MLAPIRQRREEYSAKPELLREVLEDGAQKARQASEETMELVRKAMNI